MRWLLLDVLKKLDQAEIQYCLLRGYEDLEQIENGGDVDLLVKEDQIARFREILTRLEYVALPAWGHAPHQFFVAYDQDADRWLKLDVVTSIAYGKPIQAIRTDLADTCLNRRRRREPTFVLAPEDELLTLLLHCLLDKGMFPPNRQARIRELRHEITDERYLAEQLQTYWSPEMSCLRLAALIDGASWDDLLAERPATVKHLARRQQLRILCRHLRGRALRRLDRIAGALQPRSLTVALLAPDGGGKTTLARELTRTFYLPSRYIYMGSNVEASNIGLPTTRWIHAQSRRPKSARHLPARALARVLRFTNSLVEQWYRYGVGYYHKIRGRLILFDRYVYDSQLTAPAKKSPIARARHWLLSASPKPDLVLFLDAPGEVLCARKGEHSPAILEQQRRHYLGLQKQIPQMIVVDATRNAEQVRRTVTSLIWRFYAQPPSARLSQRADFLLATAHERSGLE